MSTKVIAATLFAALAGAVVWGFVSAQTGYEIGYIAWGIGLLIGGAARALGASGQRAAVYCGGVALLSIVGGKAMAIQMALSSQLQESAEEELSRDAFEAVMRDAQDFAQLGSEQEYPQFMVTHGYADAKAVEQVTEAQINDFRSETAPQLRRWKERGPSFEEWKQDIVEDALSHTLTMETLIAGITESLGALDIVFALLGIGTAYKLALGVEGSVDNMAT